MLVGLQTSKPSEYDFIEHSYRNYDSKIGLAASASSDSAVAVIDTMMAVAYVDVYLVW